MSTITANDLKTRGVGAIEESLTYETEAMVSVRGRPRYVVMEVSQYQYLRECELEAALAQSRADLAEGRFVKESPRAHLERLQDLNAGPAAKSARGGSAASGRAASAPQAKTRKPK
jgi:hypothetical protein